MYLVSCLGFRHQLLADPWQFRHKVTINEFDKRVVTVVLKFMIVFIVTKATQKQP